MARLEVVPVSPLQPERFRPVLGDDYETVADTIVRTRSLLDGRVVWHINSTAAGGGVAELLNVLLAYARGAGVDVRWLVASGTPGFFRATKSFHNALHEAPGSLTSIDAETREIYERVCEENAAELAELIRPGDIVYLHDPQTAGMVPRIAETGATVIWRCHIGADHPGPAAKAVADYLSPMIEPAHRWIFSRRDYAWEGLDPSRVEVIMPSIDAFSPKNQDLPADVVETIVERIGLTPDGRGPATYHRQDGTVARVDRRALIVQDGPLGADVPVLAQISRWDRLKDPVGVLEGFARCRATEPHLVLVGPDAGAVADDPEGLEVYEEVVSAREALAPDVRSRVHLVSLPMDDVGENAAMVNALQRRATVVAQKSLAEGFGLTATEAMWKSKPVIAGAVGGLQDQIVDGVTGRLIDDPADLDAFAAAIDELFGDPAAIERMGAAAHERVRTHFLSTRHLLEYADLLAEVIGETRV